ncbi:hypothetical protein BH09PLA1_BH09PLA1_06330 [soil metagenome]
MSEPNRATRSELVQYGCGLRAPESSTNFDASPTLRLSKWPLIGAIARNRTPFPRSVRYGDIVKGLSIPRESCRAIYCSHVLEHLALDEFRAAIRNTHSYLRAGGMFRLLVPDLEYVARQYLESTDPRAAIEFCSSTALGRKSLPRSPSQLLTYWLSRGRRHYWMWDYKALEIELRDAGFVDIRRAAHGDSAEPRFADVEDEARWARSVGVECAR